MKKFYIILVSLLSFLTNFDNVDAMILKPSGNDAGNSGDEFIIYITLDGNQNNIPVSAVDGLLNYDSNIFTLIGSSCLVNNWTELSNLTNNRIFSYANLSFDNMINDTTINIIQVNFKINNNVKSGEYVISIDNPNATDSLGNGVSIQGGTHTIRILSNINTLSNLNLSYGNINFKENIVYYELTVDNEIDTIEIFAELEEKAASFLEGYGPRKINLSVGNNLIDVKIKSELGEIKTYTLNINRKDKNTNDNKDTSGDTPGNSGNNKPSSEQKKKSNNNYLKVLIPNYSSIIFNKLTSEYFITVPYDVYDLNFELKTEDNKATANIEGNNDLKVGNNIITITVTAEDGNKREYIINVTRTNEDIILSNNSKLKKLIISGYNFEFYSDKFDYIIKIKDENFLDINYVTEDDKSNVTIIGNANLKDNSVITINVVAEDGSTTSYKINIEKTDYIYYISLIIVIVFVSIVLLLFLRKKKLNNSNTDMKSSS